MNTKASLCSVAAAVVSLVSIQAQSPSTNDLWDISQGVTIIDHSAFDAALGGPDPYDARDLFGGLFSNYAPERDLNGGVVFDDLVPDQHVHFVEWRTASPVTLRSFYLFAKGDNPGQQAREIASFTLKAKLHGSAKYDLTLCTFTPEHPYDYVDPQTFLLLSADIPVVTAQDFRAEFANLPGQVFSGPRIIELDGFSDAAPSPPFIVAQPIDQSVVTGGTVAFTVTVSGAPPLNYQWRVNGANIFGATACSLVLTNAQLSDAGSYSVVVSNNAGSVTSSNALLTVNPSPAATLWNVNFAAYDAVKTGWAATGLATHDNWNRYTAPWQGFAALSNLKLADGTPTTVGLTVQNGAGHWGFEHPDRMYNTYCYAQDFGTVTLTLTNLPTGEYELYLYGHGGADTANTVFQLLVGGTDWGRQSTATNGSWALTNWVEGAQYVVYRGVTVTNGGAPVVIKAHPGLSRYTHLNGLQISPSGATPLPPLITAHPQSQSVSAGASVTFTATATGTAPLSYQWRFNGTNITGATTASLVLTNVQPADAGNYSVAVSNLAGTTISSNAILTVNTPAPCATPPLGLVGWWKAEGNALDQAGTSNGSLAGNTTFGGGRVGQAFVFDGSGDGVSVGNPVSLRLQTFTIEAWVKRSSATRASLDPWDSGPILCYAWGGYTLALHDNGRLFMGKVGYSAVDSSLAITDTNNFHHIAVTKTGGTVVFYLDGVSEMVGAYDPGFVFNGAAAIGARGDDLVASFLGKIDEVSVYNRALTATEIQTIHNAGGSGKCETGFPPHIVSQPVDRVVVVGDTATFSVTASGSPPLSYQWRLNGTNITGATASSLVLMNTQFSNTGSYSVVVSNSTGTATSSNATLTVNLPPASVVVQSVDAAAGGSVALPIVLTANGNENALGFSLHFNKSLLDYTSVALGSGAAGATLLVNTNQIASGKLGVAVALAADATFAAGLHEVILVGFTTAVVTNATSTTISFGDDPIGRQLSDAPGNALLAKYTNGTVSIAAVVYEGDVAPRPNGNRSATITDWVLEGRYVARLDYPTNAAEFQRADCAPRSTLGDGAISVTDWVQAGRYAAALDPLTQLGGPSSEVGPAAAGITVSAAGENEREISVTNGMLLHNQAGAVGVNLIALGDENALGFSVSFDPAKLTYTGASLGSGAAGATIHVNANDSGIGKLGFALALGSGISFAAGTQEVVNISFTAATPTTCDALLTLTDQPVPREVSNSGASSLAASYVSGTVSVNPLPALRITQANENVLLSWPLWASNFVLQQASPTLSPESWTNLDGSVNIVNGEKVLTLPLGGGARFYRLRLP